MAERQERRAVIWIVDDSPLERAMTERALHGMYNFVQFSDGSEVVERLAAGRERPDVLLLDWVMPGMSGDEVCRFIRTTAGLEDLPIILSTASRVETADIVAGLSLGANDYVAKPFVAEELRARVIAVLRAKELRDEAERERTRLQAVNRLGRALFEAGSNIEHVLHALLTSLRGLGADGAAIVLLPGDLPLMSAAQHTADPSTTALREIAMLADPATFAFESSAEARETLPPIYHPYIDRFGLRALAILPFPIRNPIRGVVTLTRDGGSEPFDADDLATIETCIEYASLAVMTAVQFDAERAARSRLHAVLDHAPIGILVGDPERGIALVNPAARALFPGIEHAATLDHLFALGAWTTLDGARIERDAWIAALGAPRRARLGFTPSGGAQKVLALSAFSGAELEGAMVAVIEDVTDQHAFATERERVAAFQEQMLGIVGHDLRSPLGAFITGIELLRATTDEQRRQSVLGRLANSAHRMTGLINQLLDVTRARLGTGIPLELASIDLVALARTLIDELSAAQPNAHFVLDAPAAVQGNWDGDRLAQVISNIASNAAQYGAAGAPITITIRQTATTATVTVHNQLVDNPIPAERLATLFDAYRRGEHSARAHRTGVGLGLYIAHEIVRAHGGQLSATSDATGTMFTVELPIRAVS